MKPLREIESVSAWASRPVQNISRASGNALTVDVEDYFHVEAFSTLIDRENWDQYDCRIEKNLDRILELFSEAGTHGTFFTLGWIAERYPNLIRKIVACGHELASHGLSHHRADSQSREEFSQDIIRAKHILEDTAGKPVHGYRAASFSINHQNIWALEELIRAGYRYSSSIYPKRYMPAAPQFAFHPISDSDFMEIPLVSIKRFGVNWPCGGGGYFRLLPYWLSVQNMRAAAKRDNRPCMFYFHPWEIDVGQPHIVGTTLKTRVRHYTNIKKMPGRLKRLLADFRWMRVDEVYPVSPIKT